MPLPGQLRDPDVTTRDPIVVLGTGPSAFFLVKSLLEQRPAQPVLVLEAGLKPFDGTSPLGDRTSQGQPFRLTPTINVGYGGTSQLWHNVLAPLDEEDFLEKPWIDHSGWPIGRDDLEMHYEEVAAFFGFSHALFSTPETLVDVETERAPLRIDDGTFTPKVFLHPQRYLRTHQAFEALKGRYPQLTVRLGCVGLAFERRGAEDRLTVYNRREKRRETIRGERYVLCCGALNNPEILLNSEVGASLPALGRYLMDHPMGNLFQFRYPERKRVKIYSALRVSRGLALKLALRLAPALQEKHRLANSAFYLRPAFAEGREDDTERLKQQLLTVRRKLKRLQLPLEEGWALARNANMIRQIIQYKTGLLSAHRLTDCMFVTEQRPRFESQLRLLDERNAYGNRSTQVDWRLSNEDLHEVRALHPFIRANLMDLNGAEETYDPASVIWADRLTSAAHHLGTVRMARDASQGCVDSNLKLFGSEQIYVCDGSVFPTAGNANPTYSCMALSGRLARHLAHA